MKTTIDEKIESIVEEILDMDPTVKGFNPGLLEYRERQFKVGAQFMRDKNMNERIKQGQVLRIIGMISDNPEARAQYIKATSPALLPDLQKRPK